MDDFISREAAFSILNAKADMAVCTNAQPYFQAAAKIIELLPKAKAVALPCRIGDRVWAIRNYKGFLNPKEGIVSQMFFSDDMELVICVKGVARGLWGKTVFATQGEAQMEIARRKGAGEWRNT